MAQDQGQTTIRDPIPNGRPESVDRIFEALADERRRIAVAYLTEVDRAVSRDELVDQVATATADPEPTGRDVHEQLAVQFHHQHLPALEAAGLVERDEVRELVSPTETAERVSAFLPER